MGVTNPQPHHVVVVAVDFSEASEHALRSGLLVTTGTEQVLRLVHVVPRTPRFSTAGWLQRQDVLTEQVPTVMRRMLEDECAALGLDLDVDSVVCDVRIGDPVAAILQATIDVEAGLLIVGTHGRSGVQRMVEASVAERLVRGSHCPVLVARPPRYSGLDSEMPAPICPDCVTARESGQGDVDWCEVHARQHVTTHTVSGRAGSGLHPASFNISTDK